MKTKTWHWTISSLKPLSSTVVDLVKKGYSIQSINVVQYRQFAGEALTNATEVYIITDIVKQ